MRQSMFVSLLLLGVAINVHARTLKNDGYSLDFPSGWIVVKQGAKFSAAHRDGSSFDALRAALPDNIQSVKVAALMSHAAALAAGLCSGEASDFELSAKDWTGSGFHCNNTSGKGHQPSETIGLTVKHGNEFYQFLLFVPRQDWETNKQQYLTLFKSLRFRS